MSSDGSKGCGESRRLLTRVNHTVFPGMVFPLEKKKGSSVPNVLDPVVVTFGWPGTPPRTPSRASVTLAFDLSRDRSGFHYLDVWLRDVGAPDKQALLQVEAAVEWHSRPQLSKVVPARADWPAAQRPVGVLLDGEGRVASFPVDTLRELTVRLEVYAVDGCGAALHKKAAADDGVDAELPARRGLNALRVRDVLTDVELRVDGQLFRAHRAVLAANSPVFCSMFTCDLKEAQEGVVEVQGASSAAFGLFLELLYTASVADWKGCEMEVLELADRYLVDHLKDVCEERLQDMHWSTALGILQHADTKPAISSVLRGRAVRVLVENWDVMHTTAKWKDFRASSPMLADAVRTAKELSVSVKK